MRIEAGVNEYGIPRGRVTGASLLAYGQAATSIILHPVTLRQLAEMKREVPKGIHICAVPTCFGGDDRGYIQLWPTPACDGVIEVTIRDKDGAVEIAHV